MLFFLAGSALFGVAGADSWTVEAQGGHAYSFRNRPSITQERWYSQSLNAGYETPGLRAPAFNPLSLNRANRTGDWTYRFGGPVATRSEAPFYGTKYDGPERLLGGALLAGGGWRLYVGGATFISVEALFTVARARPTLPGPPNAELGVTNSAIRTGLGLGHEF